jgi:hypothetical protein
MMSPSTYRRWQPAPVPPPLRRPPLPPLDPDELVIARTAAHVGLPEVLVAQWLDAASELGRPMARRPETRYQEQPATWCQDG